MEPMGSPMSQTGPVKGGGRLESPPTLGRGGWQRHTSTLDGGQPRRGVPARRPRWLHVCPGGGRWRRERRPARAQLPGRHPRPTVRSPAPDRCPPASCLWDCYAPWSGGHGEAGRVERGIPTRPISLSTNNLHRVRAGPRPRALLVGRRPTPGLLGGGGGGGRGPELRRRPGLLGDERRRQGAVPRCGSAGFPPRFELL